MGLLLTDLMFVAIMAMVTLIGMKFYVRPKEAIERVAGVAVEQREHMPDASKPGFPSVTAAAGRRASGQSEGRDHHAAPADSCRLSRSACVEDSVWFEAGS